MVRVNEDYVSFETAKLLREKRFDEHCTHVYNLNNHHLLMADFYSIGSFTHNSYLSKERPELIASPTLQMAMKWLREEHSLNVCFRPVKFPSKIEWRAYIFNKDCEPLPINAICGKAYEEACDAAIKYCLENLI